MNDEVIENIAIRHFSWSDEFPMAGVKFMSVSLQAMTVAKLIYRMMKH